MSGKWGKEGKEVELVKSDNQAGRTGTPRSSKKYKQRQRIKEEKSQGGSIRLREPRGKGKKASIFRGREEK